MIKYSLKIDCFKVDDEWKLEHTFTHTIESDLPLPTSRLREETIKASPREYVRFGPLKIKQEIL